MATRTLLKYVQMVLSAMDSDEVETITETVESIQIADLIEQCYFEIIDRRDWEFLKHRVRQLDAGTTVADLLIPADVMHVEAVRYKNFDTGKMQDVFYIPPDEFLHMQQRLTTTDSNVDSVTISDSVTMGVYNDRSPTYWTSFDEDTIFFNAYDSDNEASGLTEASSTILATVEPSWTADDAFIPDMPSRMQSLLLNESLSAAWLYLKQTANPKAESIARRQFARMEILERRTVADIKEKDYGRKPRGRTRIYTWR